MDSTPQPAPACSSCASSIDDADNFCRQCGAPAANTLPAVRSMSAVTVWQPQVPSVVKGAAVVAAGTVGQFLFRRAVRSLFAGNSQRTRAGAIRIKPPRKQRDGMIDEAQIITETVMLRRVRIRRPA